MAADLVKIRTKRFGGQRILGSEDFGDHLIFRWNGRGGQSLSTEDKSRRAISSSE